MVRKILKLVSKMGSCPFLIRSKLCPRGSGAGSASLQTPSAFAGPSLARLEAVSKLSILKPLLNTFEQTLSGQVAGPLLCSLMGHAILFGGVGLYFVVDPPRLMFGGAAARGGEVVEVSFVDGAESALRQDVAAAPQPETSPVVVSSEVIKKVEPLPKVEPRVSPPDRPDRRSPVHSSMVQQVALRQPDRLARAGENSSQTQSGGEGVPEGSEHAALGSHSGVRPLTSPKPPYPRRARLAGFEGRVEFELLVGTDGRVRQADLLQSSGRQDCDAAAQGTLTERWVFEPARLAGQPIEWRERVAVVFSLQ